ncbi:helix-turn-helix transcriptional regulator [Candidatus Enterococcus clewellii]|uniref:HTH cro/C1-type domain-containing protein n=1 Tax=Candidatus Enterococcus clewellii TaxID=1834193 RepID=A0A242K8H4_9ENTE|nr:hypothetical protein [Enterococcus sp. 9E7_DIV0242]OTP17452.1 hypothetical protein A5888_001590 [Enterococcus sp. 9E7_DIV0242]
MFKKKKQFTTSNNVEEFREQLNLSQKGLAEKVEMIARNKYNTKVTLYWKTVVAIENGKYIPSLDLAILLAIALESTVEDVFGSN